ncbi:MAG TPA: SCP2 sterol-binding domain-containing protein [Pseudomonadales bacterium]
MSANATPPEQLLARLLEDLCNAALRLDPLSSARLVPLAGRCLRFDILPPGGGAARQLTVRVHEQGIACAAGAGQTPHVILTGTLPDISRRLGGSTGGSLSIEGDEAVLADLAAIFTGLQPDLAAPLGNLIGRELADDLVGLAEAGVAFLRSAAESVTSTVRRDAASAFVNREGFDALLTRLDNLRLRVDRLDARTRLLEQHGRAGDGP